MSIDKEKLKVLLWAEAASYRADCTDWKRNTVALDEFLGEKTVVEVALELLAENELARMRNKELDLLFGRYILAMRSALIEEEHGKGPAAAMQWIYNSLAGPGELPPEEESDSQAYFYREIVAVDRGMAEVMAFHESRRAAMGKGEQSNG
ncbi:hypothetical protein [Pseudomonas sp. WS 5410]|uniref:hypothetical protein n=1 Tax=Pseudomonas sp. WS 5410 TaxID=2717485 RepID=UPI0014766B48|nr:hypothetical protein [Pseudomonas sp. WS 5410]NMY22821.1 hypothetical protein [Pseudomonas sp. WS 5410]